MAMSKSKVVDIFSGKTTNNSNFDNQSNGSKIKSTDITGSDYSSVDNDVLGAAAEDFYPNAEFSRPELKIAFILLDEITERLTEALHYSRDENFVGSDDCINRIVALLPELFCCRSIGDGFSSIIVAFNCSINNKNGEFLNEKELIVLLQVVKRINSEPFISFEEALNEIESIEDSGLIVGPESLSEFMVDNCE